MKQKIYHIIIFLLFWFCGIAYSQNPKADILWQNIINSCQLWKKRKNEIKY